MAGWKFRFLQRPAGRREAATVAKIKSGQLAGAIVTAVGLSKIYKPILAPSAWAVFAGPSSTRPAMP